MIPQSHHFFKLPLGAKPLEVRGEAASCIIKYKLTNLSFKSLEELNFGNTMLMTKEDMRHIKYIVTYMNNKYIGEEGTLGCLLH